MLLDQSFHILRQTASIFLHSKASFAAENDLKGNSLVNKLFANGINISGKTRHLSRTHQKASTLWVFAQRYQFSAQSEKILRKLKQIEKEITSMGALSSTRGCEWKIFEQTSIWLRIYFQRTEWVWWKKFQMKKEIRWKRVSTLDILCVGSRYFYSDDDELTFAFILHIFTFVFREKCVIEKHLEFSKALRRLKRIFQDLNLIKYQNLKKCSIIVWRPMIRVLKSFKGFKCRLKLEVISERSEENFEVDKSKFISKFGIILWVSWKCYSF